MRAVKLKWVFINISNKGVGRMKKQFTKRAVVGMLFIALCLIGVSLFSIEYETWNCNADPTCPKGGQCSVQIPNNFSDCWLPCAVGEWIHCKKNPS